MARLSKSKTYYSEDLKLSVLKDKYENNLSLGCAAKKYGIKAPTCICAWEKKYPVDSKLLSLSDEVITRLKFPTPKKWGGNGNKSRKICNLASANKLSIKQIQTYCYGSKIR